MLITEGIPITANPTISHLVKITQVVNLKSIMVSFQLSEKLFQLHKHLLFL